MDAEVIKIDKDEEGNGLPGSAMAVAIVFAFCVLGAGFWWFLSGTTVYEVLNAITAIVQR